MNHHYNDIRSRIADPPQWWDENAVPRYCAFSPDEAANIYAREVVLLRVQCQACEREFDVCMSWSNMDEIHHVPRFSVNAGILHYGDPPNVQCCPAGPTMNSVPVRVLEFWQSGPLKPGAPRWIRVPALEVQFPEEGE